MPTLTDQIGLVGALLGGVLALLSPCSALLLPSFFAYAVPEGRSLAARTSVFLLGSALILVPLGAGIGAIGSLLTIHRSTVTTVGGAIIVVFGVVILFGRGFTVPGAAGLLGRIGTRGMAGALALGALYGLAGFCAGPLLGAVLTVAATGGSPAYGGLLMGVYALGMAVPLYVLALLWERLSLGRRSWLRGRPVRIGRLTLHSTSVISGVLFIAIGVLFMSTAGTASLAGPLGVDTQYDLQVWLFDIGRAVSDRVVLFVVAVVALTALAVRMAVQARRIGIAERAAAPSPRGRSARPSSSVPEGGER